MMVIFSCGIMLLVKSSSSCRHQSHCQSSHSCGQVTQGASHWRARSLCHAVYSDEHGWQENGGCLAAGSARSFQRLINQLPKCPVLNIASVFWRGESVNLQARQALLCLMPRIGRLSRCRGQDGKRKGKRKKGLDYKYYIQTFRSVPSGLNAVLVKASFRPATQGSSDARAAAVTGTCSQHRAVFGSRTKRTAVVRLPSSATNCCRACGAAGNGAVAAAAAMSPSEHCPC